MKKKKIELVYTIKTEQRFDIDYDINIEEFLDHLRENGSAEILDVKLVEVNDNAAR